MTDRDFAERLLRRAARAGVALDSVAVDRLTRFWKLLAKWTTTINLTALPLDPPSDAAIDRLFVEPMAALPYFPASASRWYDLGSGGGSPAIPMKIGLPQVRLVLVEARERKAVFLRHAVRELELRAVEVVNARFEEVAKAQPHTADVVSVRAVRPDSDLADAVTNLLTAGGQLLSFQRDARPLNLPGLKMSAAHRLSCDGAATLGVYVPRGTGV